MEIISHWKEKKKIKDGTWRKKELSCSWVDKIDILKNPRITKVTYKLNTTSVNNFITFLTEL